MRGAGGIAALFTVASPATVQVSVTVVVVRVQGEVTPELRAGARLTASTEVNLASKAKLTLLDQRGTWVLTGPLRFKLGAALDGTPVAIDLVNRTQIRKTVRLAGPRVIK